MRPRCKVQIGKLVFESVISIETRKSFRTFTDTAIVKLPKKLSFRSNGKVDTAYEPQKTIRDYIKTGDVVTIYLGYDGKLVKTFEGYVARGLEPSVPIVIDIEDEMWKLKRKRVSISFKKASLKNIITAIAPDYELEIFDIDNLGSFSMKNTTAVKVLAELKKRYGLYSFFIGKKLIVGRPFSSDIVRNLPIKLYDFKKNVIISSLKYRLSKDIRLNVKAISILPNNTKHEVDLGDADGDNRTLHFFDLNPTELKKIAKRMLDRFKVDGYEGDITSFGFPIVVPGQRVKIVDDGYEKRNSEHYAEEVVERFDKGYRRIVSIGKLIVDEPDN